MVGPVSLPIKCITCPRMVEVGTKAQAKWSMSIAIITRYFS